MPTLTHAHNFKGWTYKRTKIIGGMDVGDRTRTLRDFFTLLPPVGDGMDGWKVQFRHKYKKFKWVVIKPNGKQLRTIDTNRRRGFTTAVNAIDAAVKAARMTK